MAMVDAQLGLGARKAAWNMNSLVVRPDYRGKGIGKVLMNVIEDLVSPLDVSVVFTEQTFLQAKRDNVPVILDSDKPDNTVSIRLFRVSRTKHSQGGDVHAFGL